MTTPRAQLLKGLDLLPPEVRKEALGRIDEIAPRGPDDSLDDLDPYIEAPSVVTEIGDDGEEHPTGAAPSGDAIEEAPVETPTPIESPLARLDRWSPDFVRPHNLKDHVRIDSPLFLLGNERYIFKPLPALDAATICDETTSAPYGKALVGFAVTCQKLYIETREANTIEGTDDKPEVDEVAAHDQFVRYLHAAWENFIGEAGSTFKPFTWAWQWLERCDVRRVPLPSNGARPPGERDKGGPILRVQGAGEWTAYYRGREHHLIRVAAAVAWASLGPFCTFLQITRD